MRKKNGVRRFSIGKYSIRKYNISKYSIRKYSKRRFREKDMRIGTKDFDVENHTYIMGILNVTPDSFSDGGRWQDPDIAIAHAEDMVKRGAAIIDVGGESTRPGYEMISDQEEIDRVVPVIEKLAGNIGVPVSVDTYKSHVAEAALKAGASLINDIWGFRYDSDMPGVVRKYDAVCCLMHNKKEPVYDDLIKDICSDLGESVKLAVEAGISPEKIILDPGIGFGKTCEMNLSVMKHLDEFNRLGYPMLLGASRKSMIGLTLDLPKNEREEGTIVTSVLAAINRYPFVRVHDVEKNYRAVKMYEAIRNAG